MKQARLFVVAVVWAASLLGVGMWAQASQSGAIASHTVISGENIGFQRSGLPPSGGTVTGRFVVKVDGQWFEAVPSK
jgi:hypothetical protein